MTDIAMLPIGSYEFHGSHLPFHTDCLIAEAIARSLFEANLYSSIVLPTIGISCSHEHRESISIRPETLLSLVRETIESVQIQEAADVIVLVNAQAGNHGLYSLVQELNRGLPRVLLFPRKHNWAKAAAMSGIEGDVYDDVHAGEVETSIMLATHPEIVDQDKVWDEITVERPLMHVFGIGGYSKNGVLGRPSLATADKGKALLKSLVDQCNTELQMTFDRRETRSTQQTWDARR